MVIICGLPSIILVRLPKEVSSIENRELATLDSLKNKKILNNDFQNNLENVLADQMILAQTLKLYYNFFKNLTGVSLIEKIYYDKPKNTLVPLGISEGATVYKLNKSNYLVYEPFTFESIKTRMKKHLDNINDISKKYDVSIYSFYVNKDIDAIEVNNVYKFMRDNLNKEIKYDNLNVLNTNSSYYDNYKNYFYKTDHHWNYRGSYEGYKIISSMMGNKIINYSKEICFDDIKFVGSKGKKIGDFLNYDKLCAYEFNLDEHDIYINKENKDYGNHIDYVNNKVSNSVGANHYADYYGSDHGEIVYDFHNKKDNLLIFINSYSNPINGLIASSFNKTFVIDLRAYEIDLGLSFNLDDYIHKNQIKYILFLGDNNFYIDDIFLIPII